VEVGEVISRVETAGRRVQAIATAAAAREHLVRVGAVVLATGGLAGGGIVGEPDGRLRETVLDLPVDGPPIDRWLGEHPLDPAGHEIASAGLRTDNELRPVDPRRPDAGPLFENVRIAGGLLGGQSYLRERCGDGVALASAWRAAASLSGEAIPTTAPAPVAGPVPA
jgi:glycerol-3-phosphate dehydrogenase subunit B